MKRVYSLGMNADLRCFGSFGPDLSVCRACYAARPCESSTSTHRNGATRSISTTPLAGSLAAPAFNLGYTLGSGQVFRWGRDTDGWWKGIAYQTVFHLRQVGDQIEYRASADCVETFAGWMPTPDFLGWYLRLDEIPRIRVPRDDPHLRVARDQLKGLRFVRQEPFECILSYVLSVQAHMTLTKRRIHFLSGILGNPVFFDGHTYRAFPSAADLADLDGRYFRHHRFGWRSERVALSARFVADALNRLPEQTVALDDWRKIADDLRDLPGSGVGLKVAKCIDLFSLDRLGAVPVDTWVRKLAGDWYGVTGSDAAICAWGESRGGRWAGYANEYLFSYYRELHGQTIYDRVISFCESGLPSAELPYEET